MNTIKQVNALTLNGYTGMNESSLESTFIKRQYKSNKWATFNQWKQLNRVPNKSGTGVRLTRVINSTETIEDNDQSNGLRRRNGLKYFTVFNFDDTISLDDNKNKV